MFDAVFINSNADFQKLPHNRVSSLVGINESLAFEIPMVTYCLYIFVLANRAKVQKSSWIRSDLDCWTFRINDINCGFATTADMFQQPGLNKKQVYIF